MQPAAARSPLGPPSARSGSLGGAAVRDELPVTNVQILTRAGLPVHQPLGDALITATCAGTTADNESEKDNSRMCQRSWSDR
jgi:hypothetical protein